MTKFKAIIFDMDGLLLDTERYAREAFEATCVSLEITYNESVYLRCIGTHAQATDRLLSQEMQGLNDIAAFRKAWHQTYQQLTAECASLLKDGVKDLLRHIDALGLPAAVATSSKTETAHTKLEAEGILSCFQHVIGGDQVARSKPEPDIYLRAAEALDVAPSHCLALEDSENGVRAALAAGMTVVQIPDLIAPGPELRRLGHLVLPSLTELIGLLRNK